MRARFVDYGPRATDSSRSASAIAAPRSPLTRCIDYLASWRVPHSYFIHFYVLSVLSSIFWATQLLSRGPAFRVIAARVNEEHRSKSMSLNQVWLCWALMAIQGARRLYECIATAKQSSSQMWFVHWGLGLAFYIAMTLAIWIEGTGRRVLMGSRCCSWGCWLILGSRHPPHARYHPRSSAGHQRPYAADAAVSASLFVGLGPAA